MAATGKAADSGLVSDALAAVNTSLGKKLAAPTTPTATQYVVVHADGTTGSTAVAPGASGPTWSLDSYGNPVADLTGTTGSAAASFGTDAFSNPTISF